METLSGQCTDMTNTNKKKVVFHGMKGEQIQVNMSEQDSVKHHNHTINIESGAWNKRNFSNFISKYLNIETRINVSVDADKFKLKYYKIFKYLLIYILYRVILGLYI